MNIVFFFVFNYRDICSIVDKHERSEDEFDSSTAPNPYINFTVTLIFLNLSKKAFCRQRWVVSHNII